jgi:LPS-assembly protein
MRFYGTVAFHALALPLLAGSLTAQASPLIGACSVQNSPVVLAQAPISSQPLAAQLEKPLGLKFDPILNLDPPAAGQTPVYIFGQTITGQLEDVIESSTQAEFRKLGFFIKGDYLRHDLVRDEIFAQGQVKLFREGEFYEGQRLQLKLGTTQGFFEDLSFQLSTLGGRGSAEKAEFIQPLETRLTEVRYTSCPKDRPAWELRMDSLHIDQVREVASSEFSRLYWGGSAVLPMGDLSFPLSGRRKTGFLAPKYGTSTKLGFEFLAPFYWNIAPHHDMTLYPRLITKRGVQLGSEFRFLRENALGTLNYEVLPKDNVTSETRQYGALVTTYKPAKNLSLGLQIERASDDTYFEDLGNSLLASSQRLLPSIFTANSSYRGWSVQAKAQQYQLLQDINAPLIAPYTLLPRLTLSRAEEAFARAGVAPSSWTATVEASSFRHPTLAEGDRYVAKGAMSWANFYQGFLFTPKLALHATHYAHRKDGSRDKTNQKYNNAYATRSEFQVYQNNLDGRTQSYSRVLPTFTADLSTLLERQARLGGRAVDQTLEPRLVFTKTPYTNQSNYPVFDTGGPSFNFAQIFSDEGFNGDDRVADLNQFTAGVTTRLIEPDTGNEVLRGSLGQRYYFSNQRVTLPGGVARTDRNSDVLGQLSISPIRHWTIEAQAQYTPRTEKAQAASLVSRYQPKPARVLSAAYRFVRGSSNTLDLAFQWPVAPYWYAVGRYQHAMRNLGGGLEDQRSGLVEGVAGVEYDGGCWVGRIVFQRFTTSATERNTALFLQLELNGLGRIGTSPLPVLERGIPNYQMINEIAPLPSRFENFQ